ncbi:hypothetical protein FB480_103312 [Agrobacterium vitis]|nr:hypothetical protein FB480_103312 [Agrobacterium vitis]
MTQKTENQLGRRLRIRAVFASLTVVGVSMFGPIASAAAAVEPQSVVQIADAVTQPASQTALDLLSTGSIGTTANQARNTLDNTHIDRAVANSVSSVQIPSYLSMLADRRILVMLSLIGLFVVWINRTPPNREDKRS